MPQLIKTEPLIDVLINFRSIKVIRNPLWYTDRTLNEISLGGLVVLVVVRTIQRNIVKASVSHNVMLREVFDLRFTERFIFYITG